jgi:FtsZ-interacting cell division protein ZipA
MKNILWLILIIFVVIIILILIWVWWTNRKKKAGYRALQDPSTKSEDIEIQKSEFH